MAKTPSVAPKKKVFSAKQYYQSMDGSERFYAAESITEKEKFSVYERKEVSDSKTNCVELTKNFFDTLEAAVDFANELNGEK